LRYDPAVFVPNGSGLDFQGGFFETRDFNPRDAFVSVRLLPGEEGVLAVGFIPHRRAAFEVPPGRDRLLFGIVGTISPGAKTGSVSAVALTDGPGTAGFGSELLRNELGSLGRTRLPLLSAGAIRVAWAKPFLRGDANSDGGVDISDGISVLNFLFFDGQGLLCADAADANDDGLLDVSDAIVILSTLFLGASDIPFPFPEAGFDPTLDEFPQCP